MRNDFIFTSGSVTEGHPDKLCDQISDAIVDQFLLHDECSRIVCETAVARQVIFIAARFASLANVDLAETARQVIRQVGYDTGDFNAKEATILTNITELTAEKRYPCIDLNDPDMLDQLMVEHQVTLFGYACNQTTALMPLPIVLANKLARRLSAARFERLLPYLTPDGTTQVGVEYRARKPHRIHSITIIASQLTADSVSSERLHQDIMETVIHPVFEKEHLRPDAETLIFINPTGPLIGGGPALHSGLTGRKNGIDTYGGYCRFSEAALSGKDPMRIDRVGAYAARYAAKHVVAAGLAEECEVQLSYTIGQAGPASLQVETFGSGRMEDDQIALLLKQHFDFRLGAILRDLNLRHMPNQVKGGFYRKLAAYGHMGRLDIGLPWEKTDRLTRLPNLNSRQGKQE